MQEVPAHRIAGQAAPGSAEVSVVTNVLLTCGALDDGTLAALNDALADDGDNPASVRLVEVSEHAGGRKAMEINVGAAAFNYGSECIDRLIGRVSAAKWEDPGSVVLIVQREQEHARVWGFKQAAGWKWIMRELTR